MLHSAAATTPPGLASTDPSRFPADDVAPSRWRRTKLTRKFYAPKTYIERDGHQRPPELSPGFGTWIPQARWAQLGAARRYPALCGAIRCG